jgi:hypothetical protein
MKKDNELNFSDNINYILLNLKNDIDEADNLEDKMYQEISKSEIIEYLNYVYENVDCWKDNYESKNYEMIINKYKEIESIVSQLELCLADYENKFHMNGISYSIFQVGKILFNIKKESDKNGR